MNKICAVILLSALIFATACSRDKTRAAQGAASEWLKLVDSGNYAQSWEEAANIMKANIAKEQWQAMLSRNRAPLGTLLSRKLTSVEYKEGLPGAPVGQYVVLQYESSFQNKASVLETATPTLDKDGTWRVSLYYIR
jgi:Protein of unknown function (DUF4019)